MTAIPMVFSWCLASATAAAGAPATADEPAQAFLAGNQAYEAGDYAKAIASYQAALAAGVDNGHVYYNLGNAYLRRGELGSAIAYLRLAGSRLPRSAEVRANLEFARRSTKDALPASEPPPVLRTLFFWHFNLNARETMIGITAINLLFWAALLVVLLGAKSEPLRWVVAALFVLLVALGASAIARALDPTRIAVITGREVDVRSGTSPDALVRFRLHEGTESKIVDQQDGWIRIALSDGKQGWVQADQVRAIDL